VTNSTAAPDAVRLCRFRLPGAPNLPRVGVVESARVVDLTALGAGSLTSLLESANPLIAVRALAAASTVAHPLDAVELLAPVEHQEVWAAGVTYLRSKAARMEESDFSATAYDRVYEAPRPEIFFKALGEKAVGPDAPVGIRGDATWSVPEPELALVMNSRGDLVGVTIGNDMSSRDIEGENLLYLPQAKIYDRSCALGPWIVLGCSEAEARRWEVGVTIRRGGAEVFTGSTGIDRLKRSFAELVEHLWRSQSFPHGAVLLTGTGVVPDESFTLEAGDRVAITVSGIGTLANDVIVV
jgi:2-dehydro-3-deoxy-D-arabinonate dehydratase